MSVLKCDQLNCLFITKGYCEAGNHSFSKHLPHNSFTGDKNCPAFIDKAELKSKKKTY